MMNAYGGSLTMGSVVDPGEREPLLAKLARPKHVRRLSLHKLTSQDERTTSTIFSLRILLQRPWSLKKFTESIDLLCRRNNTCKKFKGTY